MLPRSLLRIRAVDQPLAPRLDALDWSGPGRLALRCQAAMPYADPDRLPVETSVVLTGPPGAQPLAVPTERVTDPFGNASARRTHEDHARSTVVAQVDLAALVVASGRRRRARWEVRVTSEACGVRTGSRLDRRLEHGSAVAPRRVLVDGALVSTAWSPLRGLLVEVRRAYAVVTRVQRVGDAVEVDVLTPGLPPVSGVLVGRRTPEATVVPGAAPGTTTLRLAGPLLVGRLRVALDGREPVTLPVVAGLEASEVALGRHRLAVDDDGVLCVHRDVPTLVVDSLEVTAEDRMVLGGRARRVGGGQARLEGPLGRSDTSPLEVDDDRFTLRLPLTVDRWGTGATPLPANAYRLVVHERGRAVEVRAGRLADRVVDEPPVRGWTVTVAADREPTFRRTRHADPDAASRHGQRRLRSASPASPASPASSASARRDLAVFESFGGTQAGDGPRALFEGLRRRGTDLELVWSVDDAAVATPPGSRAVVRGSAAWFEAVTSARLLVNNNTFPPFVEPGPGQTYLQTWHGTPLKRIGSDAASRLSTERYVRQLRREASTWDVLLSSGPFCTEVFRRALDYPGPVLEVGRPSNDVLLGPGAVGRRSAVRERLGLAPEATAVLYAPTWRDNLRPGGSWQKVRLLDHRALLAARPDVTVLYRGHPNTGRRREVRHPARVLDVTAYPDVADLYLAADVLVTDYSAALFDFALTDRPIVLLAPDLVAYRDRVRGLYLDLEAIAPGPVVTDTRGVVEALAALEHGDDWSVRRKQLVSTFAPHDDGGATDRVLDALERRLS